MKSNRFVVCVLVPAFLLMSVFLIAPLFLGLGISLFDYNPLNAHSPFVGLANYQRLLADPLFWSSTGRTVLFVAVAAGINIMLSLLLAQLISALPWSKARAAFRTVLFLPCVAPLVGSAVVWRSGIMVTKNGMLNELLGLFGIPAVNWLGNADVVMFSLVLFTLWADVGYNVVLFCAGIDGIPTDFAEAAEIDGANAVQRFFKITLPLLGRTFAFTLMMTLIGYFQAFVQFMQLAQRGGPNNASTVLPLYIYKLGFMNNDMGYASAVAMALFVIILAVTTVQRRLNRVDWGY